MWTTSPLITFASEVRWPCMELLELALGTAVVASRNQHKSTVWRSTVTASTALPRALNSNPRKKKIAISLIAAKWHTKRKLTIGCNLHSQSDSDFPASLSPFWCQADYSLPISFRPRQPKKRCPTVRQQAVCFDISTSVCTIRESDVPKLHALPWGTLSRPCLAREMVSMPQILSCESTRDRKVPSASLRQKWPQAPLLLGTGFVPSNATLASNLKYELKFYSSPASQHSWLQLNYIRGLFFYY